MVEINGDINAGRDVNIAGGDLTVGVRLDDLIQQLQAAADGTPLQERAGRLAEEIASPGSSKAKNLLGLREIIKLATSGGSAVANVAKAATAIAAILGGV